MRILQVSSATEFGGGERHVADLSAGLAAQNHQVALAVRPNSPLLPRVPRANFYQLPLRNSVDLQSAWQLARIIKREQIEVVHAHVARDYMIAALASQLAQSNSFIVTRHLLFPLKRVNKLVLQRAKRVICVSDGVACAIKASDIVSKSKISVVPNGVNFSRYEQARLKIDAANLRGRFAPDAQFIVGTAGELRAHKGHEGFLSTAAIVAANRPDIKFFIAGEDTSPNNSYRAFLEKRITELGLNERVSLLGWIEDMNSFYAALDVFVSAAHTESFGFAILEAMASGLPVVATETDGARETIHNTVNGFLSPVHDAEHMAALLMNLLYDAEERKRISVQAKSTAANFSIERMINATLKIYAEAVHS